MFSDGVIMAETMQQMAGMIPVFCLPQYATCIQSCFPGGPETAKVPIPAARRRTSLMLGQTGSKWSGRGRQRSADWTALGILLGMHRADGKHIQFQLQRWWWRWQPCKEPFAQCKATRSTPGLGRLVIRFCR